MPLDPEIDPKVAEVSLNQSEAEQIQLAAMAAAAAGSPGRPDDYASFIEQAVAHQQAEQQHDQQQRHQDSQEPSNIVTLPSNLHQPMTTTELALKALNGSSTVTDRTPGPFTDVKNDISISDRYDAESNDSHLNFVSMDAGTSKDQPINRPNPSSVSSPLESSSDHNYSESIISKFRLDSLPVIGPGSRGGKVRLRGGKHPQLIRDRRTNHQLKGFKTIFENPSSREIVTVIDDRNENFGVKNDTSKNTEKFISPEPANHPRIILEDYNSIVTRGITTARDDAPKRGRGPSKKRLLEMGISVTPVVKKLRGRPKGSKNRATKSSYESGTKEDLGFDPRDPAILAIAESVESGLEHHPIALGYPIRPTSIARDILYISGVVKQIRPDLPLSAQDFEAGLQVNNDITVNEPSSLANEAQVSLGQSYPLGDASETMKIVYGILVASILDIQQSNLDSGDYPKYLQLLSEGISSFDLGLVGNNLDKALFHQGLEELSGKQRLKLLTSLAQLAAVKNFGDDFDPVQQFEILRLGTVGTFYLAKSAGHFKMYTQLPAAVRVENIWASSVIVKEPFTRNNDLWFEVCENKEELSKFIAYLSFRLSPYSTQDMKEFSSLIERRTIRNSALAGALTKFVEHLKDFRKQLL
ncbi:BA75_02847T0 [Komagataella pastoris]|uniref:BA75_02847T0 n=1 Tax=Komagataella pastoris TaxID=4922 RepID=A0A1B2JAJ6_PICPA|nr:BA75_02847T0 [Komagataella pastoris]